MRRFGLLIILLVFSTIESTIPVHLTLIASLILLNFVVISQLIWWLFVVGFALDLLLANFLGINFIILIFLISTFYFLKNFLWPNINYTNFPSQTVIIVSFQVVTASRLSEVLYSLIVGGVLNFNFDLRIIPVEVITTIIFFPVLSFLCLKFAPKKQLEIKF